MDITDGSNQRIDIGIEHLISGGSISYYNVVFYIDKTIKPPKLMVDSYSDALQIDNIKRDEAKEKIERSKEVIADLAGKSVTFRNLLKEMQQQFSFCYDYGTGSLLIAEESDGNILWKKQ